jgi:hypothetical protein
MIETINRVGVFSFLPLYHMYCIDIVLKAVKCDQICMCVQVYTHPVCEISCNVLQMAAPPLRFRFTSRVPFVRSAGSPSFPLVFEPYIHEVGLKIGM